MPKFKQGSSLPNVDQDQEFRREASKQVQSWCDVLFDTIEVTRELESFMESSAKEAIGG
jgi:hypothetical protein